MAEPADNEELRAGAERILKLTPEERQGMKKGLEGAKAAAAFSEEIVPDGLFDEEETSRRRTVWQLWIMLVDRNPALYPQAIAKTVDAPVEWVREVLNLPAT